VYRRNMGNGVEHVTVFEFVLACDYSVFHRFFRLLCSNLRYKHPTCLALCLQDNSYKLSPKPSHYMYKYRRFVYGDISKE
jgi:hypothetical protein